MSFALCYSRRRCYCLLLSVTGQVSFALAQSVKLGVFEQTVEKTIVDTRSIPERMALDGKINLKRKQINKALGQALP